MVGDLLRILRHLMEHLVVIISSVGCLCVLSETCISRLYLLFEKEFLQLVQIKCPRNLKYKNKNLFSPFHKAWIPGVGGRSRSVPYSDHFQAVERPWPAFRDWSERVKGKGKFPTTNSQVMWSRLNKWLLFCIILFFDQKEFGFSATATTILVTWWKVDFTGH